MINGSPKLKDNASGKLLHEFKTCFGENVTFDDFQLHKPQLSESLIQILNGFDAIVFAYPLYVDAMPSHLLSCLITMKQVGFSNKNIFVYCITNSGFYEGKQNVNAINILKNWCQQVGLQWGMGLGVGGGGALSSMGAVPLGSGPKKSLGVAFNKFAKIIEQKSGSDNIYITIDFPRLLYKLAAQLGWRQMIKANGGKTKDLNYRY